MLIRPGRDDDAEGFVALVGRCWADYPGCVLDLEHEERKLLALASYYAERDGALWVAEDGRAVVGMIAALPLEHGQWEIAKVYVHPDRLAETLDRRGLYGAFGGVEIVRAPFRLTDVPVVDG